MKQSLKTRDGGEWTDARFRSFVISALRAASRRYPPKYKALKNAFVGKKINAKSNKMAMHYKCAACRKIFVAVDVQVDHIEPVVDPIKGFETWDIFINRLFCEIENLQVLCKPCHKTKTENERKAK